MNVANISIEKVEDDVKKEFDIERTLLDKDSKIAALEFELQLQKSMLESLQMATLQFISIF